MTWSLLAVSGSAVLRATHGTGRRLPSPGSAFRSGLASTVGPLWQGAPLWQRFDGGLCIRQRSCSASLGLQLAWFLVPGLGEWTCLQQSCCWTTRHTCAGKGSLSAARLRVLTLAPYKMLQVALRSRPTRPTDTRGSPKMFGGHTADTVPKLAYAGVQWQSMSSLAVRSRCHRVLLYGVA